MKSFILGSLLAMDTEIELVRLTMKQLPDRKALAELLSLAQEAEEKAKALCDFTAEIDEKWRIRLQSSSKLPSPSSLDLLLK